MTYLDRITDMYAMVNSGQLMEAFDAYYGENVVMLEPTGQRTEGKEANRQRLLEEWVNRVEAYHGGELVAATSNEDDAVTMAESWVEVTMKGIGRFKMTEVAVQKWQGDRIVEERFYYNQP